MNEPSVNTATPQGELMTARFVNLVMQNTNMALMCLGHAPNPQTGETMRDLEAARMFIDQLEMIEAKTKGNLTRDEEKLLQQSLMHLRLAFVEVVEHPQPAKSAPAAEVPSAGETPSEEESSKRFTKKY